MRSRESGRCVVWLCMAGVYIYDCGGGGRGSGWETRKGIDRDLDRHGRLLPRCFARGPILSITSDVTAPQLVFFRKPPWSHTDNAIRVLRKCV